MKIQSSKLKSEETYTLPTKVSIPSNKLSDFGILIYGVKKVGKTSLCTQFEKTFFMMCEPGAKSFSIYQKPVLNWNAFKSYVKLLEKDTFFNCTVIDPIDLLYKFCLKEKCKEMLIDDPSEEDWGKGWRAVGDEFMEWINRLMSCGKGVIFLSHSVPKEIKNRKGESYHKISPSMPSQAWASLESIIDVWAYMCYDDEGNRVLQLQGDDHVGAGNNLDDHFKYTDGTSIKQVPMGKSKKEAYQNFMLAFDNKLVKKSSEGGLKNTKLVLKKSN